MSTKDILYNYDETKRCVILGLKKEGNTGPNGKKSNIIVTGPYNSEAYAYRDLKLLTEKNTEYTWSIRSLFFSPFPPKNNTSVGVSDESNVVEERKPKYVAVSLTSKAPVIYGIFYTKERCYSICDQIKRWKLKGSRGKWNVVEISQKSENSV